jgi:hypothetical protein
MKMLPEDEICLCYHLLSKNLKTDCEISGSHGGEDEYDSFLGYSAV